MDQVRILDAVAVGLENLLPLLGVAIELLGDLGEGIALGDRVGLGALSTWGSRGGAALDIGKVWIRGNHVWSLQKAPQA